MCVCSGGGSYRLCYKAYPDGVWSDVTSGALTIVSRPIFSPQAVVAAHETVVSISGAVDGDLVVVIPEASSCDLAANSALPLSSSSIPAVQISSASVTIPNTLSVAGSYKLCYCPAESVGDTPDDYTTLSVRLKVLASLPAAE